THAKNRPFDDPSGARLRAWLGIDRGTFYDDSRIGIFPMALCFPGTGKGGDLPPPKICAQTWRAPVLAALPQIDLTLVLGSYAIAWHLPDLKGKSVTQAVQLSAKGNNSTYVLPHPSPRNNRWLKHNPWFEQDVIPRIQHRVAQILNAPTVA
ncbi:MAG: uracil-DNA glycosylase family protein, partial [Paracoccaceae bacterium]